MIRFEEIATKALSCAGAMMLVMPTVGAAQSAKKVGSIDRVRDAEDLVQVPGTDWVIASGRKVAGSDQPGHLYLINAKTGSSEVIYPDARRTSPPANWSPAAAARRTRGTSKRTAWG